MKIKQVEELVGITKKNIRFYEDQGLLNVERAENGYREYHREDIVRLQEIKLFRKMDISIEEIEQMEKEGARFMDVKKTDIRKKRKTGAIAGAVIMTVLMAISVVFVLWVNTEDPMPVALLAILIAIPVVITGGTLAALAGRMKEIEGGEEDEASKY